MEREQDAWPPRIGQRVQVKTTNEAADVREFLPDGRVVAELYPAVGEHFWPHVARRAYMLGDLCPEYPRLVLSEPATAPWWRRAWRRVQG